ncbi:MAG: hypothetical protein LLF76_02250 [Planctomycetaceae bacterium]|nr:hypothetical protein [Planctomycetaceae bacterium]
MADEKTLGLMGSVINGVDQGGEMSIAIDEGYDEIAESSVEGTEVAVVDRGAQYVRGVCATQSWMTVISLLAGTIGTYVFYERKSGAAAATGWLKHTLTSPVIWDVEFNWNQGSYGTATFKFECRFATAATVISDVHSLMDSQAGPTLSDELELGGYRIDSAALGVLAIYGVSAFRFHLGLKLAKSSVGAALGYTSVDAELGAAGGRADGSLTFQDSSVATTVGKEAQLLTAARASLVLSGKMASGAENKKVTVAGVMFTTCSRRMVGNRQQYAETTANYIISNSLATPLTIAGANKIIVMEDAA